MNPEMPRSLPEPLLGWTHLKNMRAGCHQLACHRAGSPKTIPLGISPCLLTHGVFFMFGSGNRDTAAFDTPDQYNLSQNRAGAISFGAGPHFCAGAWAARCLIPEVALPMLFDRLPGLALCGDVAFGGWAFRGPLTVPVHWPVP